jgi:hypothetical protein
VTPQAITDAFYDSEKANAKQARKSSQENALKSFNKNSPSLFNWQKDNFPLQNNV